jgi:predicted nucleic acid-binding protein
MPSAKTFVLDAAAVLRLAQDEPGADAVAAILADAQKQKCVVLLHVINLGEVVYIIAKHFGWPVAERKRAELALLPINVIGFAEDLFWQAVKLKSEHAMSYADSFAAALALREDATLLSSDPEFNALGKALKRLSV